MATAGPSSDGDRQREKGWDLVASLCGGKCSELAARDCQYQGDMRRALRVQARARNHRLARAPAASSGRPYHRDPNASQAFAFAGAKSSRQPERHQPGAPLVGQQMIAAQALHTQDLAQRLSEAEATIEALLSGQIDAVVDSKSKTPVLLAQAQEALRASEEQYRQIVEATTDGILKIDGVARIIFVNRRFAEMLGYESREMIGASVFGFMSDAARAMAADSLQRRRRG